SSDVRESTTRESGWRQNGQCIRSGYRPHPCSAGGTPHLGQLDLLTGADPPGGELVEAADLVDELRLAHALGSVLGGIAPESVPRLDGDDGGLLALGACERGGQVQH